MQVSDRFKNAISAFIEKEKTENPDFLEATKKEDRNLDDCCNYILNEVKKLGHNAMADDEVFDIVTKYFFAEKVEKPKPVAAKVEVSKSEEKATEKESRFPIPPPKPREKSPKELLEEEGITDEFLSTISTATHGSKVILKKGLPVYSLLKTKDHYFVYDENDQIVKDDKLNNLKITHKEGMIALARYILTQNKMYETTN